MIRMSEIITAVARERECDLVHIIGKKRAQNLCLDRFIAYSMCRMLTDKSLPEIGRAFGGRDHTSILHGLRSIAAKRDLDPAFDRYMIDLEARVRQQTQPTFRRHSQRLGPAFKSVRATG